MYLRRKYDGPKLAVVVLGRLVGSVSVLSVAVANAATGDLISSMGFLGCALLSITMRGYYNERD